MEQSVPKRRYIQFRRRGISHKREYKCICYYYYYYFLFVVSKFSWL